MRTSSVTAAAVAVALGLLVCCVAGQPFDVYCDRYLDASDLSSSTAFFNYIGASNPGDNLCLPDGIFPLTSAINVFVDDIGIYGSTSTILRFQDGGFRVSGRDFRLANITLRNIGANNEELVRINGPAEFIAWRTSFIDGDGTNGGTFYLSGYAGAVNATLVETYVEGSNCLGDGGVVFIDPSNGYPVDLAVYNSTFESSYAGSDGGVVYVGPGGGTVAIYNSSLNVNDASDDGGAVFLEADSELVCVGTNFTYSSAGDTGGAIYADAYSVVSLTDTNFYYGTAGEDGGAVYAYFSVVLDIDGGVFEANQVTGYGGAVYAATLVQVTIFNATLRGNSALGTFFGGGAVFAAYLADAAIDASLFVDNYAEGTGADLFCGAAGTVCSVTGSRFFGGSSSSAALSGALTAENGAKLTVYGSEINGTSGVSRGSGISCEDATLDVDLTSVRGARTFSPGDGAAVYADTCSVSINRTRLAEGTGSLLYTTDSTVTVASSQLLDAAEYADSGSAHFVDSTTSFEAVFIARGSVGVRCEGSGSVDATASVVCENDVNVFCTGSCDVVGLDSDCSNSSTANCSITCLYTGLCQSWFGDALTSDCPCDDECYAEEDNCSPFATCTDLANGFACDCFEGYVGNGVNCSLCHNNCSSCVGTGAGDCTACSVPGTWLPYQQTVGVCDNSCHSSCATCDGNSPYNCTSCPGGTWFAAGESYGVCGTDCDSSCAACSGPYDDDCAACSGGQWLPYGQSTGQCGNVCEDSCSTCVGSGPDNCTSCSAANEWLPYTVTEGTCTTECFPTCAFCTGPTPDNCTSCVSGYFFGVGASPPAECINTCAPSCATCVGPAGDDCTSCTNSTWLPYDAVGPDACGTVCHPTCATCNGPEDNNCTSCFPGAWSPSYDPSVCSCAGVTNAAGCCDASCASCSGPTSTDCESCDTGYSLNAYTGECELICHDSCATCDGNSTTDCLSCSGSRVLSSKSRCCEANCIACSGSDSNTCTACDAGYYVDNDDCAACAEGCNECNGPEESDCADNIKEQKESLQLGLYAVGVPFAVVFVCLPVCLLVYCIVAKDEKKDGDKAAGGVEMGSNGGGGSDSDGGAGV